MNLPTSGTETALNLMRAFAGESQARNRYTIAAHTAKEQNQYLLSQVFLFTARRRSTPPGSGR